MYYVAAGTVQPMVMSDNSIPHFCVHFGRPQYDRRQPVLTDDYRGKAQSICDQLNRGEITPEKAVEMLGKIY